MKAAIWYRRKDIRVESVPEPTAPQKGEVIIKVLWCGICGTDLHEYEEGPISIPVGKPHPLTGKKAPVILGHEMIGEVVNRGIEVTNCKIGDRVVLYPVISCHDCFWCRRGKSHFCEKVAFVGRSWDGVFAEVVKVPSEICYVFPSNLPTEEGPLVEPLAAAVRAIKRAQIRKGESLLIIGAGTIGLCSLQAALALGVNPVFVLEKSAFKRKLALRMGATEAIDPEGVGFAEEIRKLCEGAGSDHVLECAGGNKTACLAVQLVRKGGKVTLMGVSGKPCSLNCTDLVYSEKEIKGSMGGGGEFENTIEMLKEKKFYLSPLITKKISLSNIVGDGFEELIRNRELSVKILVDPLS